MALAMPNQQSGRKPPRRPGRGAPTLPLFAIAALVITLLQMGTGRPVLPLGSALSAPGTERTALASTYRRPATAPNGSSWPSEAAYVDKYPFRNADGRNQIEIRNDQGVADVFLKLLDLSDMPATPVRYVFIPAGGVAVVGQLRAGDYEIRYQNLATGAAVRTLSPIEVREQPSVGGTDLLNRTVTLYGVLNGNMPIRQIPKDEF